MNKKIIIALVAVITVSVGSFIGINAYKNSRQEVPQKTVEIADNKVLEDDKEKPATQEQKQDVETILDVEQAQVVFQNLHTAITNIDYKDVAQVKKQEEIVKATTHPELTEIILNDFVNQGKEKSSKIELENMKIDEIKQVSYTLKDKEFKGCKFIYTFTAKVNDKVQEVKDLSTIVILDADKYKVIEYNIPLKK